MRFFTFLLMGFLLATQSAFAQESAFTYEENDVYVYPPEKYRCAAGDRKVTVEDVVVLPNKRIVKWATLYSPSQRKFASIVFTRPDDVPLEDFEADILFITRGSFWDMLNQCTFERPDDALSCAHGFINQAISTCKDKSGTNCWEAR